MKYFLILILLQITTSKIMSYINRKRITNNKKWMNHTKSFVKKAVKDLHKHFNKITNVHDFIKKKGIHMKHKAYNKLVAKYGKLVKDYNNSRKSVCAKLPPLWTLHDKSKEDFPPKELSCKKWYFYGQKVGHRLAMAFFKLGYKSNYSIYIKKKLLGIRSILSRFRTRKILINTGRKCYFEALLHQTKRSLLGYRKNDHSLFKIINPLHPYYLRQKALKRIINSMIRARRT